MNKTEKKLYVLLFFLLALIAGMAGNKQAEQDHLLRKINPGYSNEYKRLIQTIEAHKQFNYYQHGN